MTSLYLAKIGIKEDIMLHHYTLNAFHPLPIKKILFLIIFFRFFTLGNFLIVDLTVTQYYYVIS